MAFRKRLAAVLCFLTFFTAVPAAGAAELVTGQAFRGLDYPDKRLAGVSFADTRGHWAFLPILRLAALGVVRGRGGGLFDPGTAVTRFEALTLLGRAAGWDGTAIAGGNQGAVALPAAAWNLLTDREKAYTAEEWQQPAARQEVAAWVGKALGLTPVNTGLYPYLNAFKDGGEVDADLAPVVEAVLQRDLMAGVGAGTFAPRKSLTRAEMAALLDRLDGQFASLRGAARVEGQVLDRVETWAGSGEQVVTLRVATFAGPVINLEIKKDARGNSTADFILYKNGRLTLGRELAVGDTVRLFLQGDNVLLAETVSSSQPVSGTVLAAGEKELLLVDAVGRQYRYAVSPHVAVEGSGNVGSLLPGQPVTLTVQGGTVTRIVAAGTAATPAYSQGDSRVITGYLREINEAELIIVDTAGNERSVALAAAATISRSGSVLLPADLKRGDQVKVQVDGRGEALAVQVSGSSSRVGKIVRGKLDRVNPFDGKVVLRNTGEFFYGTWLAGDALKTLGLTREAAASLNGTGGGLLPSGNSFAGEVLVILGGSARGETGEAVVKAGASMRLLEGTLHALYLGSGEMLLEGYGDPIVFTGESVFVKNGRLVGVADLNAGDYVFVVAAAGPGAGQALLVFSEDVLPSSWRLYRGEIEAVTREGFTLEDVEEMGAAAGRPFDWEEAGESQEFELDWEPVIMGSSGSMSRSDFTYSRFTGDYEGYRAYVLVRGDVARGLLVLPRSDVGPAMTSLGRLQAVDRGAGTLTLTAARDWSAGYGRWQDRDEPLKLDARKALVVKGRSTAALEDLVPGDSLYVIHDQEQALVIAVMD
ncbi:S-layer homology domain-containing protein [Moorella sulfitireducens]|uniref:S-layer homology domain-containing protein n=1 Tax=Neomoorella sulfitireducens TaxID=2972948 RepID=UPI0021ACB2C9|nr:S-layer homology domain-containing protein [Moorella sulfitireducens]